MNKDDRRARKTDLALQTALIKLLSEKEIKDITIKELTDTADIHKATFYTHYEDIYDLYNQIEDYVINEISNLITLDPKHAYTFVFNSLVEFLYKNIDLAKALFGEKNHRSFTDKLGAMLKERYIEICKYETKSDDIPKMWDAMIEYHIKGYISLLSLLLKNNCLPEKEKLIKLLYKIDANFDKMLEE